MSCVNIGDYPRYTLRMVQGDTWIQQFIWKDANGDPVDLTGYTAKFTIKKKEVATNFLVQVTEISGIVLGGMLGTIDITLMPSQTVLKALQTTNGVWDLELTSPGGVVKTLIGGAVILILDVS